MEAVVMWFFLAIVQTHGGIGAAYGTQQECESEQAKMAASPDTIALSRCVQVTLSERGK